MHVKTIDAHVAGAAVRLVTSGLRSVEGTSLEERAAAHALDLGSVLTSLGREPRGHDGTVVAILAAPDRPDVDAAILFFGPHGSIPLCGHGVIGATLLGLWRNLIVPRRAGLVTLDTLSGDVTVRTANETTTWPRRASYVGPAASVVAANHLVPVGRRSVHVDVVAIGREHLAIVDAEAAGVPVVAARLVELQRGGLEVLRHLEAASVDGVVFIGAAPEHGVDVRSATVYADGVVERSPGGGSTVALAAVLTAMGALHTGGRFVHQGLFGSTLAAAILSVTDVLGAKTFEIEVEGDAWPTGDHEFVFHHDDPSLLMP